jgi:hypothetical protein
MRFERTAAKKLDGSDRVTEKGSDCLGVYGYGPRANDRFHTAFFSVNVDITVDNAIEFPSQNSLLSASTSALNDVVEIEALNLLPFDASIPSCH